MIKSFLLLLVGGMGLTFSSLIDSDPTDPIKEKVAQSAVVKMLQQYHYAPEDINDAFSKNCYDNFIEALDSRKRYFTTEDLAVLEQFQLTIDDEVKKGTFEFFNQATRRLEVRIDEMGVRYKSILDQPFDFTKDEIVEFDPEELEWAKNNQELDERWRLLLKYDVLKKLQSRIEKQAEDEEAEEKTTDELEQEAREAVLDDYNKWFKRIKKVRRSDRFASYLNSFAHLNDPHTDYFSPKDKEDFDINMGGKLEGIGARLQSDGDLTKISSIVPGGPVWKNKQIEVNDRILKVAQKDEEPVDVFGMRLDDVVGMIRGDKGTFVILTVEKKDGSLIKVELERDVINIDESFAKSAILNATGTIENIGYIDLPKFYSSFEGPEGNSCAADVAAEIQKLKDQNVNGIILDLRGNGGGSLKDVVDMSGLFIEDGPIVQAKPKNRSPYIYNDEDESVQYTGPLIVLINSFSASASEILAAAMQDYGRAIIVGSQSFGKGTVQRFIDLDRAVKGNAAVKPLGHLKLTMQKFYRVNGGSTQLKGVSPDIELPDRYRLIDVGEREYDNAMEWSEINGLEYAQDIYQLPNKDYLRENSKRRTQNVEDFASIYKQAEWFKANRDKTSYTLNLKEYQEYLKEKEEGNKPFEDIMDEAIASLSVMNLPQDKEKINFDEKTQASNQDWLENLNKDIYLMESLNIMKDMIESSSVTALHPAKD